MLVVLIFISCRPFTASQTGTQLCWDLILHLPIDLKKKIGRAIEKCQQNPWVLKGKIFTNYLWMVT